VRRAVFDRLQRIPLNEDEIARRRKRKLAEVLAYFDSLAANYNEHLTDDELIGYDMKTVFAVV